MNFFESIMKLLGRIFGFLGGLFSGGGSRSEGMTLYIRPKMCQQIIPIEIRTQNELSLNDSEDGYWVRKVVNTPRCPFEAEVIIHFDRNKRMLNKEINDGAFVDEQAYLDFLDNEKKD